MTRVLPVLLCGGSGTRLWPVSRGALPKQFAPLLGERSLLEVTCRRVAPRGSGRWLAVCNEAHRFLVADDLEAAGVADALVVLEPVARNTAPAIAAAAHAAVAEGADDPVLVVLPSDHLIRNEGAFLGALDVAVSEAREGALVTFGVVPDRPATGYGYIRTAEPGAEVANVEAFVEKPDAVTAAAYLDGGRHLWNSGMFVFRASRFLEELRVHRPEMARLVEDAWADRRDGEGSAVLGREAFEAIQGESVDYAVMENTSRGRVVALDAGWDDVGSWDALWSVLPHDGGGNAVEGDCVAVDVEGCYLRSSGRLIAAVGLRDQIVVETADAVLVAPRDRAQDIRTIVQELARSERDEADLPPRVPRPWGDYESIDRGDGYQVKRITVKPGAALSVQKHHHRAEHWTVVQGRARVLCDDREFELGVNESTFIPLGAIHRLKNPGDELLVLIEVQCG
ncbi:MAG: mannose-1-phosphate guanylyltransferase/mannose-6-phosphate isomerase, partial [Gemmatimonadetes bacterium]|nr:mannose-1-phosphate guanylyltransferase/mannose-6-phosphate isomerase [Gemmatimonadota bacterium]